MLHRRRLVRDRPKCHERHRLKPLRRDPRKLPGRHRRKPLHRDPRKPPGRHRLRRCALHRRSQPCKELRKRLKHLRPRRQRRRRLSKPPPRSLLKRSEARASQKRRRRNKGNGEVPARQGEFAARPSRRNTLWAATGRLSSGAPQRGTLSALLAAPQTNRVTRDARRGKSYHEAVILARRL
jgi:hypothetical protein